MMLKHEGWFVYCDRCSAELAAVETPDKAQAIAYRKGFRKVQPLSGDPYDLCDSCAIKVAGAPRTIPPLDAGDD